MKKVKIFYWTFTGLFSFMMLGSAIPDIMVADIAVKGMHDGMGYPIYLVPFLGIAKLLGVVAILIPGYPRIKEWAYAGLMIDLIGATYSLLALGTPLSDYAIMVLPLALGVLSYIFYHRKLKASTKTYELAQPTGVALTNLEAA